MNDMDGVHIGVAEPGSAGAVFMGFGKAIAAIVISICLAILVMTFVFGV